MGFYSYSLNGPVVYIDLGGKEALYGIRFEMAAIQGRDVEAMRADEIAAAPYVVGGVAVIGLGIMSGTLLAPAVSEMQYAVAARVAPLVQKANASILNTSITLHGRLSMLATSVYTRASTAVLSASVAIQNRIEQSAIRAGDLLNRAGSAIRNMANKVSSTVSDITGRLLTSPVATNMDKQQKVIDLTTSALPGVPTNNAEGFVGTIIGSATNPQEALR